MKNIITLLLFILFICTSCKTGTLVVVPIPNIEMTIYPPQTNLKGSYNNSYSNNNLFYYQKIGMINFINKNLLIATNTNNLFINNFVYLK